MMRDGSFLERGRSLLPSDDFRNITKGRIILFKGNEQYSSLEIRLEDVLEFNRCLKHEPIILSLSFSNLEPCNNE